MDSMCCILPGPLCTVCSGDPRQEQRSGLSVHSNVDFAIMLAVVSGLMHLTQAPLICASVDQHYLYLKTVIRVGRYTDFHMAIPSFSHP